MISILFQQEVVDLCKRGWWAPTAVVAATSSYCDTQTVTPRTVHQIRLRLLFSERMLQAGDMKGLNAAVLAGTEKFNQVTFGPTCSSCRFQLARARSLAVVCVNWRIVPYAGRLTVGMV